MDRQIKINNPSDAIPLLLKYAKSKVENFGVILLDADRNVIKVKNFLLEVIQVAL